MQPSEHKRDFSTAILALLRYHLKIIAIVTSRHMHYVMLDLRVRALAIDEYFEFFTTHRFFSEPNHFLWSYWSQENTEAWACCYFLLTCWTMTGVQREHARAELSKVYMLNAKNTLQGGTQKQLQKSDSQRPLVRHLVPCTESFKMINPNFLDRDGMHQFIHAEKHINGNPEGFCHFSDGYCNDRVGMQHNRGSTTSC